MKKFENTGVTLIEMLLILVIGSSVLLMILSYSTAKMDELRRDRVSLQMEQILNAAVAYYAVNGQWPDDAVGTFPAKLSANSAYLPATINNPWGNAYQIAQYPSNPDDATGLYTYVNSPTFSISTTLPNATEAQIVAGRLPFGNVAGTTVTASVSVPGQNLNNARSVNYSHVYNSGACVPVPACPAYLTPAGPVPMTPDIFVMPVQAYGAYNAPAAGAQTLSPLTGFTAYAIGPGDVHTNQSTNISGCDGTANQPCRESAGQNIPHTKNANGDWVNPPGKYYRVCLAVETHAGSVTPTTNAWGTAMGSVLVITRCVPPANQPAPAGEQIGSQFNVWSQ